MKKFMFFGLITAMFLLVGCGNNDATDDLTDVTADAEKVGETSESEDQLLTSLPLSEDDIMEEARSIFDDAFDFTKAFELEDGMTANTHLSENRAGKVTLHYMDHEEKPISVFFSFPEGSTLQAKAISTLESFNLEEDPSFQKIDRITDDGLHVVGYAIQGVDSFSVTYLSLAPNDFLADETRREAAHDMIKSMKFRELIELTQEYIDGNQPEPNDFVFNIVKQLDTELIHNTFLEVDPIEGKNKLFYKEKSEISDSTTLVPYVDDGNIMFDIGFVKNGWLFADEVLLHINGEDNITVLTSRPVRNVLSGGNIEEILTSGILSENEIETLRDAETITARFRGRDEEMDVEIPQKEVTALRELTKFYGVRTTLSNYIYTFENR
ncbi:hypothetical protein NGG61_13190 [Enterococcus casseliflavus]|uniref:hypothetical protein n=1 Tax=Enterococcus casseliflavus TaxID=37734 RepID=UPI002DBC3079|nr:hypothetical protein [Enterococcus casseliflavus]MEB8400876.1 hypothetical protein [Enterococcus casseliflavus]